MQKKWNKMYFAALDPNTITNRLDFVCISLTDRYDFDVLLYTITRKSDEWRNHNKFLYENITLTILFLERVETSVSVEETDGDRVTKTHGGLEGLGHCDIDP